MREATQQAKYGAAPTVTGSDTDNAGRGSTSSDSAVLQLTDSHPTAQARTVTPDDGRGGCDLAPSFPASLEPEQVQLTQSEARADDFESAARGLAAELLAAKGLTFSPQKQRPLTEAYSFLLQMALTQKQGLEDRAARALPISAIGFHCPAQEIAAALKDVCSRRTFYRYLADLAGAGLIAHKGRVVSVEVDGVQRPRNDGTVFSVSLSADIRAKLSPLDFKPGEDEPDPGAVLEAKISSFKTSYMRLKSNLAQILKDLTNQERANLLLNKKPLSPRVNPPSLLVSVPSSAEAISSELSALETAPKSERGPRVQAIARAVAQHLGDQGSEGFYMRVIWQTLRAVDAGVGLSPQGHSVLLWQLADLLHKAFTARSEGAARVPGKLANWHIKTWHFWEQIERVGQRRVGVSPHRASA